MCVCWPVRGTAVQFNITEQNTKTPISTQNVQSQTVIYILVGLTEMFDATAVNNLHEIIQHNKAC